MVVISVCIYGVKIIKKFQWESGFLKGGSMEPLMHQRKCGVPYVVLTLKSVKIEKFDFNVAVHYCLWADTPSCDSLLNVGL